VPKVLTVLIAPQLDQKAGDTLNCTGTFGALPDLPAISITPLKKL
jgi:hypothetical protein